MLSSKRAQLLGKGVQRMGIGHNTLQGGATEATDRAAKKAKRQRLSGTFRPE